MAKKLNSVMNSGRHAQNAPTSTVHRPVGSGDSGGKIGNFEPKFKSNLVNSSAPITGMIPNTAAAGNPIGASGSGKTDKKVAGIQKFYGR